MFLPGLLPRTLEHVSCQRVAAKNLYRHEFQASRWARSIGQTTNSLKHMYLKTGDYDASSVDLGKAEVKTLVSPVWTTEIWTTGRS